MSLSGSLSTMSLTDLLQWMEQARKSGTLRVHGEQYTKTLVLKEGRIVSSSSDDPTEHLGHFLLRHDRITEADLRKALETQEKTRIMLGKILVTIGLIDEAELRRLLVQKAEETIFGLFLWPDARFDLADGEVPKEIAVPLSLRIEDVLLKGMAWFDELQHIRKEFASARTILGRTDQPLPPEFSGSPSLARRILELVDGQRAIADICLEVHASEFTVSKLLYLMHKKGYVKVVRRVEVTAAPARKTFSNLLYEARALLQREKTEEALRVLEEAAPLSPHDIALRALREDARTAFVQHVTKHGLESDRVPTLVKPLESLTSEPLTPEEVFILSRVNGSWDVKSIVSLCPFLEADALLYLKRLKDRGILSLEAAS